MQKSVLQFASASQNVTAWYRSFASFTHLCACAIVGGGGVAIQEATAALNTSFRFFENMTASLW